MRVMVTGGGGQLAGALEQSAPAGVELAVLSINDLDITHHDAVAAQVSNLRPDVVINAAAYTAVDAAESHSERAFAVNADAAGILAVSARSAGARLVQVSTDYVFDGRQTAPYLPDDPPHPLNVYGASKLEGERRVLAAAPDALLIRTAWVYAERGKNFVHTVLRLCAERDVLNIVMDQFGSPTWAISLAQAIWRGLDRGVTGLHHWVDAGVISWYDFAVAIQEEAVALDILDRQIPIRPISSAEYPTAAVRPAHSVLDTSRTVLALDMKPAYWRDNLRIMLRQYQEGR